MGKTKFTPIPGFPGYEASPNGQIASTGSNVRGIANAHLIASAPDLYAATLPLAVSDESNPPPGVAVEHWRDAVLAARAALAKARGEAA